MADGDLMFRARIDLLRRNLRVVEGVLKLIEERFRRAPSVPVDVSAELKQLSDELRRIDGLIDDSADDDTAEAVASARALLRSVRRTLDPATTPSPTGQGVLPEGHDLDEDLVRKASANLDK